MTESGAPRCDPAWFPGISCETWRRVARPVQQEPPSRPGPGCRESGGSGRSPPAPSLRPASPPRCGRL